MRSYRRACDATILEPLHDRGAATRILAASGTIVGRIGCCPWCGSGALSVCLSAFFFAPPTRCPVHHIPHIFLVSAFSACLSPHAPCTMACRSRRRPRPSSSAVCPWCRRWPSPPSFPRIYRSIAPDRAGNGAGIGRRVCCHAVVPAADAARRLCRCRPRQIATLVPIIEKIITFVLSF